MNASANIPGVKSTCISVYEPVAGTKGGVIGTEQVTLKGKSHFLDEGLNSNPAGQARR